MLMHFARALVLSVDLVGFRFVALLDYRSQMKNGRKRTLSQTCNGPVKLLYWFLFSVNYL